MKRTLFCEHFGNEGIHVVSLFLTCAYANNRSVLSNCPVIPIKEKDRKQEESGDGSEEEEAEDKEQVLEEAKGGDEDCVGIRPSDLSVSYM